MSDTADVMTCFGSVLDSFKCLWVSKKTCWYFLQHNPNFICSVNSSTQNKPTKALILFCIMLFLNLPEVKEMDFKINILTLKSPKSFQQI